MMTSRILGISGGIVVVSATLLDVMPPKPEAFWPVTITGWVSLVASVGGLVAMGYGLHRFSQKSLFEKLDAIESAFNKKAKDLEEHFDEKIAQIRSEMQHQDNAYDSLAQVVSGLTSQMAESRMDRQHINESMRGFGNSLNNTVSSINQAISNEQQARSSFEREIVRMFGEIRRNLQP